MALIEWPSWHTNNVFIKKTPKWSGVVGGWGCCPLWPLQPWVSLESIYLLKHEVALSTTYSHNQPPTVTQTRTRTAGWTCGPISRTFLPVFNGSGAACLIVNRDCCHGPCLALNLNRARGWLREWFSRNLKQVSKLEDLPANMRIPVPRNLSSSSTSRPVNAETMLYNRGVRCFRRRERTDISSTRWSQDPHRGAVYALFH